MATKLEIPYSEAYLFLQETLKVSLDALTYLKSRAITKRQSEVFQMGYSADFDIYIKDKVFREKPVHIRPRTLTFPLIDEYSHVRGFNTRNLSPDGSGGAYSKINWDALDGFIYGFFNGLEEAYKTKTVLLCEGQFDFFSIEPYFKPSGAVLTSRPSQEMLDTLARYVERIIFIHDGDKAGIRSKEYMEKYVSKRFIVNSILPNYKDLNKWRVSDKKTFKSFFSEMAEDFLDV